MPRKKSVPAQLTSSKAQELAHLKLESSGLSLADAEQYGIKILDPLQTAALHFNFEALCGLHIRYFDFVGEPMSDWPNCEPFYRVRYLDEATGFDSQTLDAKGKPKKKLRYAQPARTAPAAYFPLGEPWPDIIEDPEQSLILTEGELKALKGCKEGFLTIGLGGVYSWKGQQFGLDLLPALKQIDWRRRNVYICFDSDYRENENVCHALSQLAEELYRYGAYVHMVNLPGGDEGQKWGLDDFLTFGGPDANDRFAQLLNEAQPLGFTRVLFSLNERYAYVRDPGLLIRRQGLAKMSPSAFTQHAESTELYQERRLLGNGEVKAEPTSAAAYWLKWPLRLEASKLTYAPGQGQLAPVKGEARPAFNIWTGWGAVPEAGNHQPFIDLVDHIFTDAEPGAKEWFLQWCAYPLQYPGMKLFSSCLIHGIKHGTGKSLIGVTLGRIYGENYTEINQKSLHKDFNGWAEAKQFVMGDDVTGSDKREDNDILKKLITQEKLTVNIKFVPEYTVPDCINYFFTSNQPDAFFLEDDDRRSFIHEVTVGPLPEDFYTEYRLWLDTEGPGAVFDYLLKLDLSGFNPAGRAFGTAAKERMVNNVRSDLASWTRQLMETPDFVAKVGDVVVPKDLFTTKELMQFYDPTGMTRVTANGMGRELSRAGLRQICSGRAVRTSDGAQHRYYAIRNIDHWLQAEPAEVTEYLNGWLSGKPPKPKKY